MTKQLVKVSYSVGHFFGAAGEYLPLLQVNFAAGGSIQLSANLSCSSLEYTEFKFQVSLSGLLIILVNKSVNGNGHVCFRTKITRFHSSIAIGTTTLGPMAQDAVIYGDLQVTFFNI